MLAVSYQWGSAPKVLWSRELPASARCLLQLGVCPKSPVVKGVACECSMSPTFGGLPQEPSGLGSCQRVLAVSYHWGSAPRAQWSRELPASARCLLPLGVCPKSPVVKGVASECSLSPTTGGLPQEPSGLGSCQRVLAGSYHWGSAPRAQWSRELPASASCLYQWGSAPRAQWSRELPASSSWLLPLGVCPKSPAV